MPLEQSDWRPAKTSRASPARRPEVEVVHGAEFAAVEPRSVQRWRRVFDYVYADGADAETFPGWVSLISGRPFLGPEMRAWLDGAVDRILEPRPASVLEIGCGLGAVARRLASSVDRYVGVDVSQLAVEALEAWARSNDVAHVAALRLAADQVMDIPGEYDTVVLNSVVQYFPGPAYLEKVVAAAIGKVKLGGRLFIGDVCDERLQTLLLTTASLSAAPEAPAAATRAQVGEALARSRELALAPSHFEALAGRLPRISSVRPLLKRGQPPNELTLFRYDVILDLDGPPPRPPPAIRWEGRDALARRLADPPQDSFRVLGIRNGWFAACGRAAERVWGAAFWPSAGVDPLDRDALDPDALVGLAAAAGCDVELRPNPVFADRFDAIFVRRGGPAGASLEDASRP